VSELPRWTAEDTEHVVCCLCQVPGTLVHDVAPFGVVRCPQCELVFISPRLRPEALQQLYDDASYFEGGVYGSGVSTDAAAPSTEARLSPAMLLQRTWTAGRLALVDRERGGAAAGRRLLEVGAGYGLFLAAAREAGWTTSGVELSRTGAKHAQDTLGLDVFCGQLEEAPLTPGFDVVCAWDTVEHVPDPLSFWDGALAGRRRRRRPVLDALRLLAPGAAAGHALVDAQADRAHLALHPAHPRAAAGPRRAGADPRGAQPARARERRAAGLAGRRRPADPQHVREDRLR